MAGRDCKVSPCAFVIIQPMFQRIVRGLELTLILFILAMIAGYSNPSITDGMEKMRVYTRQIEFDYFSWMGNAALIKLRSASIGAPQLFDQAAQKQIVTEYFAAHTANF